VPPTIVRAELNESTIANVLSDSHILDCAWITGYPEIAISVGQATVRASAAVIALSALNDWLACMIGACMELTSLPAHWSYA
jgi:hypothetical protein